MGNFDVHETDENEQEIIDLSRSEGYLEAQICFEEALRLEKKKSSKELRARKARRKTARIFQESSKKLRESSEVTIHEACRETMSSPEARTLFDPASPEPRPK